jgi:hypothetical protein
VTSLVMVKTIKILLKSWLEKVEHSNRPDAKRQFHFVFF